jgi:hypothetical protein
MKTLFKPLAALLCSTLLLTACDKTAAPLNSEPAAAVSVAVLDEAAEHYVKLVLALGQYDSNYVDAYYGPAEWAEAVKQQPQPLPELLAEAQLLRDALQAHSETDAMLKLRLHYLQRQLTALISHADTLQNGTAASFEQQASELYDTQPPQQDLSSFAPVLAELEQLVPGEGSLTERVVAYRKNFVIPADKLQLVFERAIAECRDRTLQRISLPAQENFTLEFVTDKPWSGYNWYQGKAYSLIQINTERPIDISRAVDLGCHEGYPGHHTYNALLETELKQKRNWVEFSVYALFSPQSLIAEGTANYGIDIAFPGEQKLAFERDVLYPLAGLDPSQAASYDRFLKLMARLSYAGNETARLLLNGEIDEEQFVALQQQYLLQSEAEARQRLRFVRSYGAYVINYNWGKDLVKQYVEQARSEDERWQRFISLLSTPKLPSSLAW